MDNAVAGSLDDSVINAVGFFVGGGGAVGAGAYFPTNAKAKKVTRFLKTFEPLQ